MLGAAGGYYKVTFFRRHCPLLEELSLLVCLLTVGLRRVGETLIDILVSHCSDDWLLDTVYTMGIVGGQLLGQFCFALREGCFLPTR